MGRSSATPSADPCPAAPRHPVTIGSPPECLQELALCVMVHALRGGRPTHRPSPPHDPQEHSPWTSTSQDRHRHRLHRRRASASSASSRRRSRRDAVAKVERHRPRRPGHADRPDRLDRRPRCTDPAAMAAARRHRRRPAVGTVGSTQSARPSAAAVDAVGTQVKAGADVARTADPRVGSSPSSATSRSGSSRSSSSCARSRCPAPSPRIPDQVSKAIEVGKARVQGRRAAARPRSPRPTARLTPSTLAGAVSPRRVRAAEGPLFGGGLLASARSIGRRAP